MFLLFASVFIITGPISRVAVILTKDLHKEKKNTEIKRLDKEYLRNALTENEALGRSRRSDEVLVYKELNCAKLLEIRMEKCDRILAPGFEVEDEKRFPSDLKSLPCAKIGK